MVPHRQAIRQSHRSRVETHGRVPDGMRELADAKVGSLLRFASEPVLSARVTLTVAPDSAVTRPALAQATIDLNGQIVRAQASGQDMRAAIERMAARLRVRLDRSARDWAAVIRRSGYASRPLTPDEAVAELDLLDYDFHLFTERSTGEDSVIYRLGDRYRLAQARPKPTRLGPLPAAVTLSEHAAPVLTLAEDIARLDWLGQPFVFFVNTETGRAGLLYHRYDGHYGLVSSER